ncbi:phage/plasmid primase, P4 family [Desulfurivibrio alkaliphilus]|uniref:Phage/plasmid primase, P4 family n=1 Tax=Desulfurivibrio alkaliphilus (strain DSM 19089 / UNIQEM U267 / AHT2) TaxID=589865 RepID=D6Z329_DESAT|nr:phage/plasmid primase, P4 family [Desulfurivibrio alkaliphilus]ADH85954.1 phage/plasmid primase, P4 family [Desulfurivibrio alkaliphilus AHT 2]
MTTPNHQSGNRGQIVTGHHYTATKATKNQDAITRFRAAMLADGLNPPAEIPTDGREVRFPGEGKGRDNTAGYCKFNGTTGKYGDFIRDLHRVWPDKKEVSEDDTRHQEAADRARSIWNEADRARQDHPYLWKKEVGHKDLRATRDGELIIPLIDNAGEIQTLQFIDANGNKKFLSGGRKKGCFHLIGKLSDDPSTVIVCEGYATGMSIRMETGAGVACAMDAGNLLSVAKAIKEICPESEIILAADDDHQTDGNPGLASAAEAARAVNGLLAVPDFGDDRPDGATDFNDLARAKGHYAVLRCIQAATPPPTGPAVLTYSDPLEAAKVFSESAPPLRFWQDQFFIYDGSAYHDESANDIKAALYDFLADAKVVVDGKLQKYKANRNRVGEVLDALKAAVNLADRITAPSFIGNSGRDASEYIAAGNGILHLPTRELLPPDPAFFTRNALPFNYNHDAPPPAAWLQFLNSLWPDDPEAIKTLQEIMGYLLTSDTTQQKIFGIVGPMRSGKGTIGRIITALLGQANVAGPTLSALSQQFGIASLIGKKAAIISDARLGSRADQAAITERLLAISGEDNISVPRKFLNDFTGKMDVRFVILTNELPRLADSSGALANRFVMLTMTQSFLGRERPGLTKDLLAELPSILNWALDGLERLTSRGYFVQPASSREAMQELADLSSPIGAFVRDRCEVGQGLAVEVGLLYEAWKQWCNDHGREHPGTSQSFGRDIRAAVPGISTKQKRAGGDIIRVYEGLTLSRSVTRV